MNNNNDFSFATGADIDLRLTRKRLYVTIISIGILLISLGLIFLRLENIVTGEGRVYADQEWYVYAPVEETIENVIVHIGDNVQKGDPLFQLNTTELELELTRHKETLLRTQEELKNLEWEIQLAQIRPQNPEILTAKDRLALLKEIEAIQDAMTSSLANLSDQRAIRSLEFYRQKIENLRTQMDTANTNWWLKWEENGLWEIEKSKLHSREEQLRKIEKNLEDELRLLEKKKEALTIKAPLSGKVVEIYQRHNGMKPNKGDRLAKIALLNQRYRVRTYLNQRNYDLIRTGMTVRMESDVFNSVLEGYVYGTVSRVGEDYNTFYSDEVNPSKFEVWIDIDQTPYPLVLGSTLKVDILLGKSSLLELFFKRPENRQTLTLDDQKGEKP